MRKTVAFSGLLAGIAAVVYSVVQPWSEAELLLLATSSIYPGMYFDKFAECWLEGYCGLSAIGGGAIAVSLLMILLLRKQERTIAAFPAAAVSSGVMLKTVAFLQAWTDAQNQADKKVYKVTTEANIGTAWNSSGSSAVDESLGFNAILISGERKIGDYLLGAYADQFWLVILGAVFIIAGIISWCHWRRKQKLAKEVPVQEIPEEVPEEAKPEAPVKTVKREERRIVLYCTVMDIRGDYALVKYDDTGVESEVAIALLPFGIDVGDKLKFENYEFERV